MADDLMAKFEAEMKALQQSPVKRKRPTTTKVISSKPVIAAKPVTIAKAPVPPTYGQVPSYPTYNQVSVASRPSSTHAVSSTNSYSAPGPSMPPGGLSEIERQQSAYDYEKVAAAAAQKKAAAAAYGVNSNSNMGRNSRGGSNYSSRDRRDDRNSDRRDDRRDRGDDRDRRYDNRDRRNYHDDRRGYDDRSRSTNPPKKNAFDYKNVTVNPKVGTFRYSGGYVWEDKTMAEWPQNDHRLFVGDLGNEVTDDLLAHTFNKYKSFAKARVIRDKFNNKSKGFGFVSFLDPFDMVKAMKELNGQYCGNRPMKLRKSTWKDRNVRSKKQLKKLREKKRAKLNFQ